MIYPIRLKQLAKIGLVFSVILLWGCNESSDDKIEATYSSLWDNVFNSCAVGCHLPTATNGTEDGPDLSTKTLFYANTVNKTIGTDYPSWIRTGDCDSVNLIKQPGSTNESLIAGSLIQSVADSISANFQNSNGQSCTNAFGVHETLNVTLSDQSTINALSAWINDGAPEK